jgi:hypothetical protein
VSDEVVAEFAEAQRQVPDATQQLFAIQTVEHYAHRQKIAQTDWRIIGPRMRLAPVEHARPARQL